MEVKVLGLNLLLSSNIIHSVWRLNLHVTEIL